MDRIDRLRTFLAVADHSSFAEAARRLRLSPAAATRAIATLERDLGVALFRRTTRSVRLTDEGAAYLERCRHALDELDDAARSVRGENAEPRGTLSITAPIVFGRMHIAPIAGRMIKAFPQLNVRLMLIDRLVGLVEEGIDVAVRIADLADSSLHAVRIGEVQRVLVASPGYLQTRGVPSTPAELAGHDIVAFENLALNNEWRFNASARQAFRFEPRLLLNNADAAIDAAMAGLGITRVLSYQVASHVAEGRLEHVLPNLAPPPVAVSLLFQGNRRRSPNVRAFLATAHEYFREFPLPRVSGVVAGIPQIRSPPTRQQ
ncbi:MAG: LysR family transcriptional regulator [Arenimonas sp.]|jgi:DNA-binding transcriptional LysR family regulator